MENRKVILIIDDEPDLVETMRFFLENLEFRVLTAFRPEEGIEKAHLNPDLILLDLMMPGMSGHEVCKRLKGDPSTRYIPIIMLTSLDRTIDKVEAFNLGVVDYVGKHFPFEEILARIKAAISERTLTASPEAEQEKNKRIVELREIIEQKNIRVFFQPLLTLSGKQTIGYEALTRGPKGSALESPITLFSLAVETNMFFELDKLCRTVMIRKTGFFSPGQILFLNTDPFILNTEHFKSMEFLKDSAITPARLCLEITERTCIKNFAKLSAELDYFKSMGVKVAVDDVGEGYSSLKAIAELKPEFIKIDISLVRNVDSDGIKTSLVQVIVDLARRMNSHTVAEGIETEGEYQKLLSLGVEYGQGYLFVRPFEAV